MTDVAPIKRIFDVNEIAEEQLLCNRSLLGHDWVEEKGDLSTPGVRQIAGIRWLVRCQRCEKKRLYIISKVTGEILSRQYIDAPSWRRTGQVAGDTVRLELFRRRGELTQPKHGRQPAAASTS